MSRPRIIFMGTPAFAVASLDALLKAGHQVVAVVTAPDRPAGRGLQLKASPVKERALFAGIPVLQPERLKSPEFLSALNAFHADLQVVVAFRMLPEAVWSPPRMGTFNLHASLLPDYRGAAPINWAVMNGERRSGITTFLIRHEIDTGDILLQESMDIAPDETAGELHDRMMMAGADLVVRTVEGLAAGALRPRSQQKVGMLHEAPKLNSANCRIRFDRRAKQVHDHVRGLSPYPGAWCELIQNGTSNMHFKLLRTRTTELPVADASPGKLLMKDGKLLVACIDLWLELTEIQAEGKRRMTASEYMRGIHGTVEWSLQ